LAPKINFSGWDCTSNLASYLCNRRALKDAVECLYKVRISKDYRAVADGKNWPKDYTPEERQQIIEAGKSDALWCWRLWNDFSSKWPEMEQKLSNTTIDQGMRGVQIDTDLLNNYIMQSHEMKANTEKIIPWIEDAESEDWDEFTVKPTSTKCISEQCRRVGIPCAPVKSDDEEEYEAWETLYSPQHPWIKAVSSWRSINKLYQTFVTMKSRVRPDGTMPFALKYFGGHTGRWSGDAKINMQNQRRKPILCNEHGLLETDEARIDAALAEKTLPDWVKYSIDFRHLIVPRPSKKMIVSDLSQIEPRVLAWLGGNWPLLDLMRGNMSVYEAFARTSMGFTGDRLDKKSAFYKMLKIQVLGLGYGAGWLKFIAIAAGNGVDLCEGEPEFTEETDAYTGEVFKVPGYGSNSRRIVAEFREKNPRITGLWKAMDDSFKRSIGEDFSVQLPSGRRLRYDSVRAAIRIDKNKRTGKPERRTVYTADVGGIRKPFYGGKLVENVTQATARDVFGWQLVNMVDRGWPSLFTCHDENILEVDADVTAKDVEEEMSKCPPWMPGLPVSAEASEVAHYQK
jgi:hypothetical protein